MSKVKTLSTREIEAIKMYSRVMRAYPSTASQKEMFDALYKRDVVVATPGGGYCLSALGVRLLREFRNG